MFTFFLSYEKSNLPKPSISGGFHLAHRYTVYTFLLFTWSPFLLNSCHYFCNHTFTSQNLLLQQASDGKEILKNSLRQIFLGRKERHIMFNIFFVVCFWLSGRHLKKTNLVFLFLWKNLKILHLGICISIWLVPNSSLSL